MVILSLALLFSLPAQAQPDKEWKTWFGHAAVGYGSLNGDASNAADDGFSFDGGAVYKPDTWPIGLAIDLGFNNFDLKQHVVQAADATDGDVDVWSLTTGATWSPDTGGTVGVMLSGGVGGYHIDAKVTNPGLYVGPICDPWMWWCYPGLIPGDVITGHQDTTKLGYNAGIGITFALETDSEIYLEAKYHRIETRVATEYIPIVVGYRW